MCLEIPFTSIHIKSFICNGTVGIFTLKNGHTRDIKPTEQSVCNMINLHLTPKYQRSTELPWSCNHGKKKQNKTKTFS